MDDDVEEVGAKAPVEVLMKSSFPRLRRKGGCCCCYRLRRHRRSVGKQFETTTMATASLTTAHDSHRKTFYYPESSLKARSSSSQMALYFSCSWTRSASSLSHSFWSLPVCLSPSAARASASLNRVLRSRMVSSYDSSRERASASETSRDFMLFPTTFNSSSNSWILASASSARCSARSRSTSNIARRREASSYFLSESSAIICASCSESSKAAMRSSFWKLKFSSTLRPLSDSSAALEASSNFSLAMPRRSSDLSRSSSTNWQRLWSADTSASDSWTCLLADSRLVLAVERFSVVVLRSFSTCWIFLLRELISSSRSLRFPWSSFILSSACSARSTDSSFSFFICCIFLRIASMVLEAASLPAPFDDDIFAVLLGVFFRWKNKKTFFFLFGGEEDGFLEEGVKSKSPC